MAFVALDGSVVVGLQTRFPSGQVGFGVDRRFEWNGSVLEILQFVAVVGREVFVLGNEFVVLGESVGLAWTLRSCCRSNRRAASSWTRIFSLREIVSL